MKGSIDQLPSGAYRARLTFPDGTRRSLGSFPSLLLAQGAVDTASYELALSPASVGVLLEEYGERVLDLRETNNLPGDHRNDRSRWNTHIKTHDIVRIPLVSLRRKHIKGWWRDIGRKDLAHQTMCNALNVIRVIIGFAIDDEIIDTHPFPEFETPAPRGVDDDWTWAEADEQRALVDAAGTMHGYLIAFAMGTGLRAGELAALHLVDLHLDGDDPRAVIRFGGPNEPTKGGKPREVPLFGMALDAVRAWLAGLPKYAKSNPNGLVFPGMRGAYRNPDHILEWNLWKSILATAKIVRRFRWHDLRHTFATSCLSGTWGRRWSLEEIQALMGHSDIKTTQRYARFSAGALRDAAREARGVQVTTRSRALQVVETIPDGGDFQNRCLRPLGHSSESALFEAQNSLSSSVARDQFRDRGLAVIRSLSVGQINDAERVAGELAASVLDAPIVALALRVKQGGPTALAAMIELAALAAQTGATGEERVA